MHVISRKSLLEFTKKYPHSYTALDHWYRNIKNGDFSSFVQLRYVFPNADQVSNLTVFNIGGNKFRLIAAVHYNVKKVYIRNIMTHDEYDKNKWKEL